MKLRDLMRGTRAVHALELPLVNVPNPGAEESPELTEARARDASAFGTTVDQMPTTARVGLRVLLPGETAEVYSAARQFAIDKGNPTPTEDDPNYNLGVQVQTLARAAIDPDSDPAKPKLWAGDGDTVESAVADLLDNPHVNRDSLTFLCDHWEWWCDRVNPQIKNLNDQQMLALLGELVVNPDAFLSYRPGVQRSLVPFMAALALSSLLPKSESGGGSTVNTLNGSTAESLLLQ
jgi:hypothetical protein